MSLPQIVGYIDYTAAAGDTFDSLALAAYSEEKLASYIIISNRQYVDTLIFEGGEKLQIPILDRIETPETLPPWRK